MFPEEVVKDCQASIQVALAKLAEKLRPEEEQEGMRDLRRIEVCLSTIACIVELLELRQRRSGFKVDGTV